MTLDASRHDEQPEAVKAAARAIVQRWQQRSLLPDAALWMRARDDVRALNLSPTSETALLSEIYKHVFFHLPI